MAEQKYYKIAVYAICKNEEDYVDKWMTSMWEADYICVLDTGSTDKTYTMLQNYAAQFPGKVIVSQQVFKPWRFDTARNESMKLIPTDADICICTDLDEILTETWAEKLRAVWTDDANVGNYLYAWSHLENGAPGRVFWYNKVHDNRDNWYWRFPVHESLTFKGQGKPVNVQVDKDFIMLHHYPNLKTNRSNYLPLLELRAQEYPDDLYGLVYLAHEYKYQNLPDKCIEFVEGNLLPRFYAQGDDDMNCITDLHMFLGDCYRMKGLDTLAEMHYLAGINADPHFRDNYLRLGRLYLDHHKPEDAIEVINRGLKDSRRLFWWLECNTAWSYQPWDLLCLAYWDIGARETSLACAEIAYKYNEADPRLKENVKQIKDALGL